MLLNTKKNKPSNGCTFQVAKIMVISSYFLLLFIPYAASITFNFTEIGTENQNKDIYTMGSAYITISGLHVSPDAGAGRATYVKPLHLWDNTSGELASFTTDFSFNIYTLEAPYDGDGLTFFLAENNSVIGDLQSMGLPVEAFQANNSNTIPFVAVEFDTLSNPDWDPKNSSGYLIGDHVGIDINSLDSVRSEKWFHDMNGSRSCRASITYNSISKNLSVTFTNYQNNTNVLRTIYYVIDLKSVLPEWVIFGFSAANSYQRATYSVISWAFNSSVIQTDTTNPDSVKDTNRTGLKVWLIVGLSFLITFVGMLAFCVWRKKKKNGEEEQRFDIGMNSEFEMGTGPRKFSYRELARSTGNFAEDEKLGEGGFGGVYRGFLKESSTHVAIKRVSKSSKQGIKEYASEVKIISRLRHRNLVQLTGWCHEKGELLLVYEFLENGSLDLHLFMEKSLLTWGTRYKIAHGLASALLYLHEDWEQCVLHRDIKSSNVMLDSNFNAKLGDFGLAKLVDHEKGSETTLLAGTLGYLAPECVVTGKASRESDVYSFGVVALEIACGRKPIVHMAQEDQIRLIQWVWESYGVGSLLEAVDPRLGSDYEEKEIKNLMIIGLWCVHPAPELRPSMRQVFQVLNSEASLPVLPSKMPVASYLSPLTFSSYGVTSIIQTQSSSSASSSGL